MCAYLKYDVMIGKKSEEEMQKMEEEKLNRYNLKQIS
jgi:hypothetical protein